MSRADLAGLIALALAYFLGAAQASTVAQARAYAVLALMVAAYGGAVALLSRLPIERLYRISMYLSLRVARAWILIRALRAEQQAQRNADRAYHVKALARKDEIIRQRETERDEAWKAAEFWEYQARKLGYEDRP